MICVGLLIMWCQVQLPKPIDSFCLTYQPVVQEKGDGKIVGKLAVKKRILANELVYKAQCKGQN